jgi:2,4-dienoyl-CoA reductase-like NADH-dependent reductase (Old Yellow Enzyme family)
MKNKFMLAPLTNQQSYENGKLAKAEFDWLLKRAQGGFGIVMTCAAHVQEIGKGFPGQLGIFSDDLIEGHERLAKGIKSEGSLAMIQLHHAGMRSPQEVIKKQPVCPSSDRKTGARALSLAEVIQLKNDFIAAGIRAKRCGYNGVEIHGAHGYILTQFLSQSINFRTDEYGGSLTNRSRLLFEIIEGIRKECGNEFLIGVRLSPERFGMKLSEIKIIFERIVKEGKVDFIDMSLWDSFKYPEEERENEENEEEKKTLLYHFASIDRKDVKLTVAGNIRSGEDLLSVLENNVDFVTVGRAAILHHDFPLKVINNPKFETINTPVSRAYLNNEGLSDVFVDYMKRWPNFVDE